MERRESLAIGKKKTKICRNQLPYLFSTRETFAVGGCFWPRFSHLPSYFLTKLSFLNFESNRWLLSSTPVRNTVTWAWHALRDTTWWLRNRYTHDGHTPRPAGKTGNGEKSWHPEVCEGSCRCLWSEHNRYLPAPRSSLRSTSKAVCLNCSWEWPGGWGRRETRR